MRNGGDQSPKIISSKEKSRTERRKNQVWGVKSHKTRLLLPAVPDPTAQNVSTKDQRYNKIRKQKRRRDLVVKVRILNFEFRIPRFDGSKNFRTDQLLEKQ